MAVPKKRKSKAKTRSRRANHDKIKTPNLQRCPECYAPKQPHRACMDCGYYNSEQVVEKWDIV